MSRQRIMLSVMVDLDAMPGTFHTPESARDNVEAILLSSIPHYDPVVVLNED